MYNYRYVSFYAAPFWDFFSWFNLASTPKPSSFPSSSLFESFKKKHGSEAQRQKKWEIHVFAHISSIHVLYVCNAKTQPDNVPRSLCIVSISFAGDPQALEKVNWIGNLKRLISSYFCISFYQLAKSWPKELNNSNPVMNPPPPRTVVLEAWLSLQRKRSTSKNIQKLSGNKSRKKRTRLLTHISHISLIMSSLFAIVPQGSRRVTSWTEHRSCHWRSPCSETFDRHHLATWKDGYNYNI